MSRKVYFRADAGAGIGYGHFIRSLALADMLKSDFECVMFTQEPTPYQISEAEKVCPLVSLPADESKFEKFLEYLTGEEIVVLDNYFYGTEYQQQIKDKGCKLVCIDDIHDKKFVADVVINHATALHRSDFNLEPYTQLCTGLNWSLLRKEFIESNPSPSGDREGVFVCFGGSDFCNITTKVLEAISTKQFGCDIHVVLGDANKQGMYLLDKYKKSNIKFYNSLSAYQMVDIMTKCKIGILPASGLLWESLYLGLPSIFGYYVENQKEICLRNPTIKRSFCIGDYRDVSISALANQIEKFYKNQGDIDAIAIKDIKSNFIALFKSQLTNRKAESSDCDLYFEWANDPLTRSMAFNKEQISYKDHSKWFKRKLADENSVLYIFYVKDEPIGQVRFDIEDGKAEIDISMDKKYRGKGYGTQMLRNAIFMLSLDKPGIMPISDVLVENIASQKVFEKCGFVKVENTKKYYKYELRHTV